MNRKEVLINAKHWLEVDGWTKGVMVNNCTGAMCLYGALRKSVWGNPNKYDPFDIPNKMLLAGTVVALQSIIDDELSVWNDYEDTTKADVMELLDKAIKAEDND